MVHCPHCDARAFLFDHGVVHRPTCLDCDRPLPMPTSAGQHAHGPMSPYPRARPRHRERRPHAS